VGYYQGDYYMAGGLVFDTMPSHSTSMPGGAPMTEAGVLGVLGGLRDPAIELLKKYGPAVAGGAAAALGGVAARRLLGGGGERRYRRMNVTNVRALRRSMRRVQGFAKLARATVQFTQRVKMKKHRRR
jgi:hypothetical protein